MTQPYVGEICLWGLNFAPLNYALCDGQQLPISSNQSLFALLGTQFGGNGTTTLALPDLRGRVPMGWTQGQRNNGQRGGTETVTLTTSELPRHNHGLTVTNQTGGSNNPAQNIFAAADGANAYTAPGSLTGLASNSISYAGDNQAHENRQPSLVINFTISLQGLFPPRN